jgi:hypothetical protein
MAKAISKYVDCSIGISGKISDTAAIIFASYFYEGLADGLSSNQFIYSKVNRRP